MSRMLLVSSSEKVTSFFRELLNDAFDHIDLEESGYGARNLLDEKEYDFILINSPLCDEFGHELAATISLKTSAGIVILVKKELFEQTNEKLSEFGIFVIEKPINKTLLMQTIKLATISSKRLERLREENEDLQNRIEEIRIVDRAKLVLIQSLGMNENDAHKYIEKQAMELRLSKISIAKNILSTYEY